MTPEILLLELRPIETSMKDLKLLDIWVFRMMFVLLNPSVTHPNRDDINKALRKGCLK